MEYANAFLTRNNKKTSQSSTTTQQITSTLTNQKNQDENISIDDDSSQNIQLLILRELRKANTMAERETNESKAMHQELRSLEEQRFKMTQMFIERSLTLQKQMLDCLRSTRRIDSPGGLRPSIGSINNNGNLNDSGSSDGNPFKIFPKTQSSRPQFILSKKKK